MGARPFSALNVMKRILKTILYFMGSQWRAASVIWSDFLVLETSRAATFWILCSLEIEYSGKPYSILLQESRIKMRLEFVLQILQKSLGRVGEVWKNLDGTTIFGLNASPCRTYPFKIIFIFLIYA